MRSKTLNFEGMFRVGPGIMRGQVAKMPLRKSGSTGGPDNVHESFDQWLYVVAGGGQPP